MVSSHTQLSCHPLKIPCEWHDMFLSHWWSYNCTHKDLIAHLLDLIKVYHTAYLACVAWTIFPLVEHNFFELLLTDDANCWWEIWLSGFTKFAPFFKNKKRFDRPTKKMGYTLVCVAQCVCHNRGLVWSVIIGRVFVTFIDCEVSLFIYRF